MRSRPSAGTASPRRRTAGSSTRGNEADDTLDVAGYASRRVIKKIPLSGRPNNISISPDGRKVYVGIREDVGNNPGVADVIDTVSLTKVKSVRTEGLGRQPDARGRHSDVKEVAKIPVGQVPKRNHTMVIPASLPSTN